MELFMNWTYSPHSEDNRNYKATKQYRIIFMKYGTFHADSVYMMKKILYKRW